MNDYSIALQNPLQLCFVLERMTFYKGPGIYFPLVRYEDKTWLAMP
jgi:hypothetical protein